MENKDDMKKYFENTKKQKDMRSQYIKDLRHDTYAEFGKVKESAKRATTWVKSKLAFLGHVDLIMATKTYWTNKPQKDKIKMARRVFFWGFVLLFPIQVVFNNGEWVNFITENGTLEFSMPLINWIPKAFIYFINSFQILLPWEKWWLAGELGGGFILVKLLIYVWVIFEVLIRIYWSNNILNAETIINIEVEQYILSFVKEEANRDVRDRIVDKCKVVLKDSKIKDYRLIQMFDHAWMAHNWKYEFRLDQIKGGKADVKESIISTN